MDQNNFPEMDSNTSGMNNTPEFGNMPQMDNMSQMGNAPQMNNNEPKYTKNSGMWKGFILGMLLATIVFCVTMAARLIIDGNLTSIITNDGEQNVEYQNMQQIYDKADRIQQLLDQYYYYDENLGDVADGMYQGLIDSLGDKYADYYDADELTAVTESNQGTYCGIGVVVQLDEESGEIVAVNPYDYAPGYKAGIRAGDHIIAVDDVVVTGMSLDEAVLLIRGEEGTTVKISVTRDGKPMDFTVTREIIENHTIVTKVLENNIGYLRITSFDGVTLEQFKTGMAELQDKGVDGIIFDVRSNGGGYYYTVTSMLDMLLPEGKIVYTEDKFGNQEVEYSDADCIDLPICVLVDGFTASASEIFAGAIQDYELGAIIGVQTYGKGIVQNTYSLGDGSAVKFTIAGYFTPNGRDIHGKGITPDIEVTLPETLPEGEEAYDESGYLKLEYDTQLAEGIKYMNERLGND